MAVSTYNPKDIKLVFGGFVATGYADDSHLEVEALSDGITSKAGNDGEIVRSINPDQRHSITLRLQQTSAFNDVLSQAYDIDRVTPGGVMLPVAVVDLNGRTNFAAGQAWVTKKPNSEFGTEAGDREWVIHTGEPTVYNVGGANR